MKQKSEATEVLAILRMGDSNAYYHLTPLAMSEQVKKIHIIRPVAESQLYRVPNSTHHHITEKNTLYRLWRTYRYAINLGKRPDVGLLVSFFAFPYGFIAILAGLRLQKPVHIGFVGSDWHRDCQKWYGPLLSWFFKKATFITVTGKSMVIPMVDKGYPKQDLKYLIHGVDTDKFSFRQTDQTSYDCIFVGALIPLKCVENILKAILLLQQKGKEVSLLIVGDGPLRKELEEFTIRQKINNLVTFVGYQKDISAFITQANAIIIASEREGMPFALIEGMVSGTIPISTAVGSIPEYIVDETNGILVQKNSVESLTDGINRLLDDKALGEKIRRNLLETRNNYSFTNVSRSWTKWLRTYC